MIVRLNLLTITMDGEEIRLPLGTFDDAPADELNALLWLEGMRPCIHSHHSSDEDFAACTGASNKIIVFGFDDSSVADAIG